jgi:hypothetical protein
MPVPAGNLMTSNLPRWNEGSVTAWATFGAAMAEATASLERADRGELVGGLDRLTEATEALADRFVHARRARRTQQRRVASVYQRD